MIATNKELMHILREIGWKISKDEVGDSCCIYSLENCKILAIPSIKNLTSESILGCVAAITTNEFDKAISIIYGKNKKNIPIVSSRYKDFNYHKESITNDTIIKLSDDLISWGKQQDIEKGLWHYRSLPTDAKGAFPVRHLAALAIHGDSEKLSYYLENFKKGNRMNFVPYIKEEMIESALKLSKVINFKNNSFMNK
ncbi:DUF6990 domain-containing protein [Methylobacillus sp. Pita1]|uniref:DUF6990 domain-containing protein n=1 Tax=Methylobacillus sp. Pita1 TaxID=3382642 RepID=UPI0038B4F483